MPVRDIKIGYAAGKAKPTAPAKAGRRGRKPSMNSVVSAKSGVYANSIEPFPAFNPSLLIQPFPPASIGPHGSPSPQERTPVSTPTSSNRSESPFSSTLTTGLSSPKVLPSPKPRTGKHDLPNVPPARYDMASSPLNQAVVKSVLSGDTLLLAAVNNPTKERILSLAYCTSPHLKKDADEPWAFDSRDALRKLVVGKNVQFRVLYSIPNTDRQYGIVYLSDGRRLPEEMVKQGWLKLREDAGRKEDAEEALTQIDGLRVLEAKARADDLGVWQTSGGRIEVAHDLGNAQTFLDAWKGKSIDGIVERVLSGDRMLVRLILSPTKHVQVMTLLAGIRAPTTERVNPSNGQTQPAEEHGNEAKQFVETRLLQRNVSVEVLGLSPQNQLVATVKHLVKGSIAIFLLEAGLARCTDFHSTMLGANMKALRDAEKTAQAAKRGVFKDHVAKAAGSASSLEAQVTRVFSADVIFVQNRAGVEKRVNISSVRGPRPSDPKEALFRDEAKEFLRKKIIGKRVRMSIDGTRPASGEYDAKEVVTIILNDKNIGLLLVQEGWCSVIRHRRDDTDRAPNYDELLAAQEQAKEEKKGMWSDKPPKTKNFVDASETLQKAKLNLGTLQRQKKIPAIVDFVKGGSRFSVLIPREGIKLNFVLGGIRAPKSARNAGDKSEPFGQEAHDLATKRLTQRDVEIDVHNTDKVGGFIGELYINKESFAKILVEEGLATVHAYSAEQSGNATELLAAEQRAKNAHKGLWVDWDPSVDVPLELEAPETTNGDAVVERAKDYRDVMITHINPDGRLKLQMIGTGTSALETMMTQFKSFHMSPQNNVPLQGPPKTGEFVAAKFSEDGQWYRAKILHNDRAAKEADVLYIDYGNGEKLPWSKLRALSQPQFNTQKLRGQAVDAQLSLLQFPTDQHYLAESIQYVNELAAGRELVANVDYTDPQGVLYVTLMEPESKSLSDNLNADIIDAGHAMLPTKLKGWERSFGDVLKTLKQKEAEAVKERRGLWEYGDLRDDE